MNKWNCTQRVGNICKVAHSSIKHHYANWWPKTVCNSHFYTNGKSVCYNWLHLKIALNKREKKGMRAVSSFAACRITSKWRAASAISSVQLFHLSLDLYEPMVIYCQGEPKALKNANGNGQANIPCSRNDRKGSSEAPKPLSYFLFTPVMCMIFHAIYCVLLK